MPLPADFEKSLWAAAEQLWTNSGLPPSEYATPVLALIFLKYADHRFAEAEKELASKSQRRGGITRDDYHGRGVVYVPAKARFRVLRELPEQEDIGKAINEAMKAIEAENDDLKDVLPKAYGRFDTKTLRELLELFGTIPDDVEGDVFGRIYEYFLSHFSMRAGGLEYFTPYSIARLIVEIVEPYQGRIFDPACGTGGMFVQSASFLATRGKRPEDEISIYGIERNQNISSLAKMNLAVHGLSGDIRETNTYYDDIHEQVGKFDFVMANPPFNQSAVDKERIKDDTKRFPFGMPSVDNANYLWIQIFYSALNAKGRAGFVMANSASDARGSELEIRKKLIETGAVDVIVALSSNFFYTMTLPVTLWFLDKGKTAHKDEVLFIDARHVFRQVDRAHREFTAEQIEFLANVVRLYRGEAVENRAQSKKLLAEFFPKGKYVDVAGLCKVVARKEIAAQGWSLNPGRYVGVAPPGAVRLQRLQLKNVYGFQNLQLTFPNGPAVVFVGANGAGKSTVLDAIAMFLAPLTAMLRNADPKKEAHRLGPWAIHTGAKQAEAQLELNIAGAVQTWKLGTTRITAKRVVDAAMAQWVEHVHEALEADEFVSVPVFCYYPAVRFQRQDVTPTKHAKRSRPTLRQLQAYEDAFHTEHQSLWDIVDWFRHEEDLENEVRLSGNPEHRNLRLEMVRQAVVRFMDQLSLNSFDELRVRRDPNDATKASLVLRKDGMELSLDTLSDGERGVILLVADLAQRLAAANPGAADPLSGAGLVLIDEIELHLHPRWQRVVLPELIRTFRGCQFIVTTHSPQVLSRVEREHIRLLSKFDVVESLPRTEGRDSNAILEELMGVSGRPEDAEAEIAELARLIDDENVPAARRKLKELEERFGPNDLDVLRLGAMLVAIEDDAE